MDPEIARKLSANFDEIKNAIVLRELWRLMSSSQRMVEYNSTDAILGSTETGQVLQELLAKGMVKGLSPVEERGDERIERWYLVTLTQDFAEQYEKYLRQLHIKSNMKEINELIKAVNEEMKLQATRGVEKCAIGYSNMPEGFGSNANLYYALLLMEVEGDIIIKSIKDESRWIPNAKHPERQHLRDFIFHIHLSEIRNIVAPKSIGETPQRIKWDTLEVILDGGSRPRVYKEGKQILPGGKAKVVRSGDIKILAALIQAQGGVVQMYALKDVLNSDPAKDASELKDRAVHDSIYRLKKYAGLKNIENEKLKGYWLK